MDQGPVGVLKGIGIILSSGRVLNFLLMSLLMGYGMGSIDSYLFLYLEELGEAGALCTASLTLEVSGFSYLLNHGDQGQRDRPMAESILSALCFWFSGTPRLPGRDHALAVPFSISLPVAQSLMALRAALILTPDFNCPCMRLSKAGSAVCTPDPSCNCPAKKRGHGPAPSKLQSDEAPGCSNSFCGGCAR